MKKHYIVVLFRLILNAVSEIIYGVHTCVCVHVCVYNFGRYPIFWILMRLRPLWSLKRKRNSLSLWPFIWHYDFWPFATLRGQSRLLIKWVFINKPIYHEPLIWGMKLSLMTNSNYIWSVIWPYGIDLWWHWDVKLRVHRKGDWRGFAGDTNAVHGELTFLVNWYVLEIDL